MDNVLLVVIIIVITSVEVVVCVLYHMTLSIHIMWLSVKNSESASLFKGCNKERN